MLENYIFFQICEHSLDMYKYSYFSNYISFCRDFKNSIKLANFSKRDNERLFAICGYLMIIFGLDVDTAMEYIGKYFLEDRYLDYEKPTRFIKDYFSKSFN